MTRTTTLFALALAACVPEVQGTDAGAPLGEDDATDAAVTCPTPEPAVLDLPLESSLDEDDCVGDDRSFIHAVSVAIEVRTVLQAAMAGDGFTPWVQLYDDAGQLVAEDLGHLDGGDAMLQAVVDPGTYRVVLTSRFPGDTGPFLYAVTDLCAPEPPRLEEAIGGLELLEEHAGNTLLPVEDTVCDHLDDGDALEWLGGLEIVE